MLWRPRLDMAMHGGITWDGDQFMKRSLVHVSVLLLIISHVVKADVWQDPLQIYGYYSYISITPLRFPVPPATRTATWNFRAIRQPEACENQLVDVYLQYGSLPLVNAKNETYPEHFHVDEASQHHLEVLTDNTTQSIVLSWPTPGTWFAGVFKREPDRKMRQQGLFMKCRYNITTHLSVDVVREIETVTLDTESPVSVPSTGKLVRFLIGHSVVRFVVHILECSGADCDIAVDLYEEDHLHTSSNTSRCPTQPCFYTVTSPLLGIWHYAKFTPSSEAVTLKVKISTEECSKPEGSSTSLHGETVSECIMHSRVNRIQHVDRTFHVDFKFMDNSTRPVNISLPVVPGKVSLLPFELSNADIGGTLKLNISLDSATSESDETFSVCGLLFRGQILSVWDNSSLGCSDSNNLTNQILVTKGNSSSGHVYVPYPAPGIWYVALTVWCSKNDGNSNSTMLTSCLKSSFNVTMTVSTDRCVDNACSDHGTCKDYAYGTAIVIHSLCKCAAGWRGYGCSDGTEAFTSGEQLEEVLLLTLSNLFFIPAIILAVYRRLYIEAAVFFVNMFLSTMYHACDGDRVDKYKYCMTDYEIMAFYDFFSSTISSWVTLVAMARLNLALTVTLQVGGLLAMIVPVLKNRWSLWTFCLPFIAGMGILVVSWGLRCKSRKKCYPSWRRYVYCLLPGAVIAGSGALVFATAVTVKNYRYTHSLWHACMFTGVTFLLPKTRDGANSRLNPEYASLMADHTDSLQEDEDEIP